MLNTMIKHPVAKPIIKNDLKPTTPMYSASRKR
jgi:hypothetical protein